MPQSFLIGHSALEEGGNLEEVALNTRLLLRIVDLLTTQNKILYAINKSLGLSGQEEVNPETIEVPFLEESN